VRGGGEGNLLKMILESDKGLKCATERSGGTGEEANQAIRQKGWMMISESVSYEYTRMKFF